jgi:hypothetical protein
VGDDELGFDVGSSEGCPLGCKVGNLENVGDEVVGFAVGSLEGSDVGYKSVGTEVGLANVGTPLGSPVGTMVGSKMEFNRRRTNKFLPLCGYKFTYGVAVTFTCSDFDVWFRD